MVSGQANAILLRIGLIFYLRYRLMARPGCEGTLEWGQ